MFSRLSVYVRKRNIECRSELYEAFRQAYRFKDTNEPPKCENIDTVINYSQFMEVKEGPGKFTYYATTQVEGKKPVYNAAGLQLASNIRHFKYIITADHKTELYTSESAQNQIWTKWKTGDFVAPDAPDSFINEPDSNLSKLNEHKKILLNVQQQNFVKK
jgi:hypothetical protein